MTVTNSLRPADTIKRAAIGRSIHLGSILALGIGLAAAWLTLSRGLPAGYDSLGHVYRLVERDYLLRQGLLYSRWSPFLGYGYGFPLFNYYQPLLYYLAEPLLLLGLTPHPALQITLGIAMVLAALGMYCWASELVGLGPAIVATVAYTLSPYAVYTLVTRSGFSEVIALALMPWGLWAIHQYARGRGTAYGLVCGAILAAILCAHLFTAYLYTIVLIFYTISLGLAVRSCRTFWQRQLGLLWPIALGLGLAAWFWLPAMAETQYIQIERMLEIGDPSTGTGLMSIWTIFSSPLLSFGKALPVTVLPRLSWVAGGLALCGAVTGLLALRTPIVRVHVQVAAVTLLLTLFMVTPLARWLWAAIPMLRLGLFPFRFFGVASLCLALLAGVGSGALMALLAQRSHSSEWRRWAEGSIICGLSVALTLYALGGPLGSYNPARQPANLAEIARFEKDAGLLGTLAKGEYLPRSVKVLPAAEAPIAGSERLAPGSLPRGARVIESRYDLLSYVVVVESPQAFQAVFNTFYFPGWWASIAGRRVPIVATDPHGLISLDVPAGRHEIKVGFGTTPVRAMATVLSVVSLVALVALAMRGSRLSYAKGKLFPLINPESLQQA